MRKISALLFAGALLASTSFAGAQAVLNTTLLDGFDTNTVTEWTAPTGFATILYSNESQTGSGGSLELDDGGFSWEVQKTYTGQLANDGSYRLTFFYQNGPDSNTGDDAAGLFESADVNLNGIRVADDFIPAVPTEQLTWQAVTTDATALTAGDLTVRFGGDSGDTGGGRIRLLLDEITLEELEVLPLLGRTTPVSGAQIDETATITVVPTSGSGTYTSVSFDVGDDDSIEATDNTPGDGFTFDFDTSTLADGPVSIAVEITDDSSASNEFVIDYIINNSQGVQTIYSENFDDAFVGTPEALPENWTRVDWDGEGNPASSPRGTVSQETTEPYAGAGALRIDYGSGSDFTFRYTVVSPTFDGLKANYQISGALRGDGFTRLYLMVSDDGGTTWELNAASALNPGASTAVWTEAVTAPFDSGSELTRVATHSISGDIASQWDEIVVFASELDALTNANAWDLY